MGFVEKVCQIAVSNTYGTSFGAQPGGSLTKSELQFLTPTTARALYGASSKWAEMHAYLQNQLEMSMAGIRRNSFYDWLMSSNKPGMGRLVQIHRHGMTKSLIQPFIIADQEAMWNEQHWRVATSYTEAAYEALGDKVWTAVNENPPGGGVPANVVLRVTSPWNTPLHADYFLPGKRVYVMHSGASSVYELHQFKIIRAGLVAGNAAVDIEVRKEQEIKDPVHSATPTGILLTSVNNIHNVESWCYNMVNVNPLNSVPFWFQTYRKIRQVDSIYQETFAKLSSDNAWFNKFGDLPMARRNAQDEMRSQAEFVNAFLLGDRISSNQTLALWESLDSILSTGGTSVDPGTGGMLIAKRANMVGVYQQLDDCNQVTDVAGGTINLKNFCEIDLYNIKRARESTGRPFKDIDIYTNENIADLFQVGYFAYSKTKTGDIARINMEGNQDKEAWGFPYRSFKLYKPIGVRAHLLVNSTFDDLAQVASDAGIGAIGNWLMILDIGNGGTIYPSILASKRVQLTTGELQALAKVDKTWGCVMENPTISTTATSETCTAIVSAPLNSQIKCNFTGFV